MQFFALSEHCATNLLRVNSSWTGKKWLAKLEWKAKDEGKTYLLPFFATFSPVFLVSPNKVCLRNAQISSKINQILSGLLGRAVKGGQD